MNPHSHAITIVEATPEGGLLRTLDRFGRPELERRGPGTLCLPRRFLARVSLRHHSVRPAAR